MPLIVTPGAVDADAYLDVATADALAAGDLGSFAAKWLAAVTEGGTGPNRTRKEAALRRAAQDVDELTGYAGDRSSSVQALVFPRLVDWDGSAFVIPGGVTRAAYRQALYIFATAEVADAAKVRQARGLSSFTEPNVGGTVAADPTAGRFDPSLESLLRPYAIAGTVGWIRLS